MEDPEIRSAPRLFVGGFETVGVDRTELAEIMHRSCMLRRGQSARPALVFSSNGQGISLAESDPEFAWVMNKADIIHADGMSVVFASKLFTMGKLPERVATTDFFHDAAKVAQRENLRFFFLGAKEDMIKQAYENARKRYPNVDWVGYRNGYMDRDEEKDVCAQIVEAKPDILWLGMGKPRQEHWAVRNAENLRGVGWVKTCGGLFDFLAGAKRAPQWMQSTGFEWAFRMLREPTRLGKRYAVTNVHAAYLLARRTRREPLQTDDLG